LGDRGWGVGEAVLRWRIWGGRRGVRGGGACEALAVVGEIDRAAAGGGEEEHVADRGLLDGEAFGFFREPGGRVGDFVRGGWDGGEAEGVCG
jgi:hypothetical protein